MGGIESLDAGCLSDCKEENGSPTNLQYLEKQAYLNFGVVDAGTGVSLGINLIFQ